MRIQSLERPSHHRWQGLLAALLLVGCWLWSAGVAAQGAVSEVDAPGIDIGVQPLGLPSGVISSLLQRDRVLQQALSSAGLGARFHPFWRGADIAPLVVAGRLEAGLLGDMPTLQSVAQGEAVIVGLVKQTSTAIVGRGLSQLGELAGRRIAYVEGSSAHYTLLQGLHAAGLDEQRVRLLALPVTEMPDALMRGQIDAFAAWEPAPSIALASSREHRVIFRGLTSDYLVFSRTFIERRPEQALELVAGFVRAIEWLRRSPANQERAIQWVKADAKAFSGKIQNISDEQALRVLRQDLLEVPSAPAIPGRLSTPPLRNEFEFLYRQGRLPEPARWRFVEDAFRYDGLQQVMSNPRRYRLAVFDYQE